MHDMDIITSFTPVGAEVLGFQSTCFYGMDFIGV